MIQQPLLHARDGGRTGSGPAGQRLARTALEHPQRNLAARQHLHETGVDPRRKARMQLDQASLGLHGRLLHVLDHLHRVRVAHGHQRHLTREDLAGRRLQCQRPQHGLPLLPGHQPPCGKR